MITAQIESLTNVLEELIPFFEGHHSELALFQDRMPLDPQYKLYLERDARNEVLFASLREDGKIIGYWVSFVAPGMHYRRTLTCTMDILYVHPDHRGQAAGFKLADCVKTEAIRRGVKVWWAGSKNHKEIGWFLKAIGMEKAEEYYVMWLGD